MSNNGLQKGASYDTILYVKRCKLWTENIQKI